jgi:hypothetical protein
LIPRFIPVIKMPRSKQEFAAIIDAYADAKASKNPILLSMMKGHVERALDEMFPEGGEENKEF